MSVLFFGKQGDFHCERAAEFIETNFADATIVMGRTGEPFPRDHADWTGEYLISYLSRWIIPGALLNRASVAAINFHPGPPSYPGIGCTNFALYNEESVFCVVLVAAAVIGEDHEGIIADRCSVGVVELE